MVIPRQDFLLPSAFKPNTRESVSGLMKEVEGKGRRKMKLRRIERGGGGSGGEREIRNDKGKKKKKRKTIRGRRSRKNGCSWCAKIVTTSSIHKQTE